MAAIVRVHHPNLTSEERKKQIEIIKKALVEFYKETHKGKEERNGKVREMVNR